MSSVEVAKQRNIARANLVVKSLKFASSFSYEVVS